MGYFEIVDPETTTNLITNPSFEENVTDGWTFFTGLDGTRARDTSTSLFGVASCKLTASSSGNTQQTSSSVSLADGESITVSVWLRRTSAISHDVLLYDSTNTTARATGTITASDGTWEQVTLSWTNSTGSPVDVDVRVRNKEADGSSELWFDAVQLEKKAYATTFCDGDQPGCEWTGTPHASTSERKHWSTGGRVRDLADDLSFYVEQMIGVGMAGVSSRYRVLGGRDGALYRLTRTPARSFALQGIIIGSTHSDWHDKRQAVIDVFAPRKPRVGYPPVPRILRYSGATTEKEIEVVYEDGLGITGKNGFTDSFALSLVAPDPYWYGLGERADVLDTNDTLAVKYVAAREDGVWNAMGPPSAVSGTPSVRALARGEDGTIYVGGSFTNWDGIANADYIASWDGSSWSALDTGFSGEVWDLVIGPDGTLYAGGNFSTSTVKSWNGSSWTALGALTDTVFGLAIGRDGLLYASDDAGVVREWDGSSWSTTGSIGTFTEIYGLAAAPDGTIYAGTSGGDGAFVKAWDGSSWTSLGDDFGNIIYALAVAPDGTVYAGGTFTSNFTRVASWNGTAWSDLGTGADSTVWALTVSDAGELYAGGGFSTIGDIDFSGSVAAWDGFAWRHTDIDLNQAGGTIVYSVLTYKDDVYVGFDVAGNAAAAGQTTVSNSDDNSSANLAPAYPVIEIERSGGTDAKIQTIINETTGVALWLDYDLLDEEKVTIDLRPGQRRMVSTQFGEQWKILPQSDIAGWQLTPGDNQVMVYVSEGGSPTVTATIRWRPRYWSSD